MANPKSKAAFLAMVVILFGVLLALGSTFFDDERNIYIALFRKYEVDPRIKDMVFVSANTTCGATQEQLRELPPSLIADFIEANATDAGLYDLSVFSGMASIERFSVAGRRKTEAASPGMIGTKTAVQVSRIGFSETRSEALLCVQMDDSAMMLSFVKTGLREWEIADEDGL